MVINNARCFECAKFHHYYTHNRTHMAVVKSLTWTHTPTHELLVGCIYQFGPGLLLKGIKFDPEGNQHMRLEFARSNTKVTKPKWPPGFPLPPGAPTGFPFIPATGNPASLSPLSQQTGFPGVLPTNFLPHLAGCKSFIWWILFWLYDCF